MSKMFLQLSLGLLAGICIPLAGQAAATGALKQLSGHVPKVVSQLSATGRVAATDDVSLAIGLPLRNPASLEALLQQITDPTSPNFRHYLTAEQFTAQFGPSEQDVQSVVEFARSNGLSLIRTHGNRLLVEVHGPATAVEQAFHVTLKKYQHPTENRVFFSPDTEPSVPASLPLLDVTGLSNYPRPHPFMKPLTTRPASAALIGSAPDGSYLGYDFRKAYVPGTTLTGAGQKIALVQFDGYFPSDIAAYAQLAGLPTLSLTNILLDGFDGLPTLTGGEAEVELDLEMVNSMAPGLSQVLVYEENPNLFRPSVVLNQIAMDNAARQVSCSWGWSGGPNATINQIFQQMALQGQSFFQASGDSDSCLPGQADDPNRIFAPCSDAYVTTVGGTKLITDALGNFVTESVWNDRVPNNGQGGNYGSGGGISTYYTTPIWQQGFGTAANHGSATGRNFPDVAFTATDVYIIVDNGQAFSSGGTSAAAPLWAGYMALVNQQAAAKGQASVGFINPLIYALAKTAAYTNLFNDTTLGDNTWPGNPTNFFAVPGYDLCTGLGTPKGTNLINALTSAISPSVIISAPLPPWGTNMAALNGSNPNGAWFLFVQDDKLLDVGLIANGWSVALTTANPVGFAADNQLYVSPTNSSVLTNSYWPVTMAVTNYGPSFSTNVYVTATIPLTGTFLISSNLTAGSVKILGETLTWTIGNLVTNAGASLTLNYYATTPGLYTNDARVFATTSDPNADDDTGSAVLQVSSVILPPQLTPSFSAGNGGFQLSVTNSPGQTVVIQASTNLISWVPVFTNVEPFTFTNFDSTNYLMRFYRAVVTP